jgi:protein-tyrosine kinase
MRTKRGKGRFLYLDEPRSPIAEAYRTLRTNIQYSSVAKELHTLMVTSAGPGEGKTRTAANLAIIMAQSGKRVLLVDADLRHPSVHETLGIPNTLGLTHLLIREQPFESVVREFPLTLLDTIPAGPVPPNPADLLGSERMTELIEEFKSKYDLVIFDTPPVLPVTDGQLLAPHMDGVLLVMRWGQVLREQAKRAKGLLDHVGANVIGAVLNGKKTEMPAYYY